MEPIGPMSSAQPGPRNATASVTSVHVVASVPEKALTLGRTTTAANKLVTLATSAMTNTTRRPGSSPPARRFVALASARRMMNQANARSVSEAASHPAIARAGHSILDGATHANVIAPTSTDVESRPVARLSDRGDRVRGFGVGRLVAGCSGIARPTGSVIPRLQALSIHLSPDRTRRIRYVLLPPTRRPTLRRIDHPSLPVRVHRSHMSPHPSRLEWSKSADCPFAVR